MKRTSHENCNFRRPLLGDTTVCVQSGESGHRDDIESNIDSLCRCSDEIKRSLATVEHDNNQVATSSGHVHPVMDSPKTAIIKVSFYFAGRYYKQITEIKGGCFL